MWSGSQLSLWASTSSPLVVNQHITESGESGSVGKAIITTLYGPAIFRGCCWLIAGRIPPDNHVLLRCVKCNVWHIHLFKTFTGGLQEIFLKDKALWKQCFEYELHHQARALLHGWVYLRQKSSCVVLYCACSLETPPLESCRWPAASTFDPPWIEASIMKPHTQLSGI